MITLANVIAAVESNGNDAAIRFEPELYQKIINSYARGISMTWPAIIPILAEIEKINTCSPDTAAMIAATSWGQYQILGENLYGPCKLKRTISDYLADGVSGYQQNITFAAFVATRGFNAAQSVATMSSDDMQRFAKFYNGPGNVAAYTAMMGDKYAKLTKLQHEG